MAQAPKASTEAGAEPDPSMDDILASIRRILNEDEKAAKPPADGVLVLDPSMIVDEGGPAEPAPIDLSAPTSTPEPVAPHATELQPALEESRDLAITDDVARHAPLPELPSPPPVVTRDAIGSERPLVAPAAAAAAAHSVGSLVRTLAAERSAAVTRGGLTIEDLVREEVRPVLKEWLDAHLPPLVERMVRAELERVVGRTV